MPAQNGGPAQIALGNGGVLRVEAVTPHVLRVRLTEDGCFEEPALVRYGILETASEAGQCTVEEGEGQVIVATGGARLSVRRSGRCASPSARTRGARSRSPLWSSRGGPACPPP